MNNMKSIAIALALSLAACAAPGGPNTSEAEQESTESCGATCNVADPQAYLGCRTACGDPGIPFTSYCGQGGVCMWQPHTCGYTGDGVCHRWYTKEYQNLCPGLVCPPGSPI